jgi:hypothetical protein
MAAPTRLGSGGVAVLGETPANRNCRRPSDTVVAESHLPLVLEGLRAISGLVAIVALLGFVALTPLSNALAGGETFLQDQAVGSTPPSSESRPTTTSAQAQGPRVTTQAAVLPQQPPTTVFYLACTAEQGMIADWGESVGMDIGGSAFSSGRSYNVLHVCDDAQLQDATETVMAYMLNSSDGTNVQLIDLRSVR